MNAVKQGWRVAVVDERSMAGGNCTHLGTIPSKALRQSVRRMMQYNTMPMFRAVGEPRWFSFPEVMKAADDVITKQVKGAPKAMPAIVCICIPVAPNLLAAMKYQ